MKLKAKEHRRREDTNDFFDITEETRLLIEIKDILDEINIILLVLKDQRTVLTAMIHEIHGNRTPPCPDPKPAKPQLKDTYPMVDKNIMDFERMQERANRAYKTVGIQLNY
jgi:hypothetical protein